MANYTGISFPFRVNSQGKVVISEVTDMDAPHINESIEQILHTDFGERVMENEIYSSLNALLFQPNDISLQTLIADNIVDALKLDERITVQNSGISFEVEDGYLYATVKYTADYNQKQYQTTVKLGEVITNE